MLRLERKCLHNAVPHSTPSISSTNRLARPQVQPKQSKTSRLSLIQCYISVLTRRYRRRWRILYLASTSQHIRDSWVIRWALKRKLGTMLPTLLVLSREFQVKLVGVSRDQTFAPSTTSSQMMWECQNGPSQRIIWQCLTNTRRHSLQDLRVIEQLSSTTSLEWTINFITPWICRLRELL